MKLSSDELAPVAAAAPEAASTPQHTVLMVAYQFPPFAESTGSQRVVSFVRHLPRHGWRPVILTAREGVYLETDDRTLAAVPQPLAVYRARGWDTARDLSVAGRYLRWLALPDRWVTWAAWACATGLRAVREQRPAALWATFPIPSATLAAVALHRLTGLPLVVDLRDPVVYEGWPADPTVRRAYAWIERQVVRHASRVVVTTPSARQLYLDRYPERAPRSFCLIGNGVDDDAIRVTDDVGGPANGPITLLHSGLMEIPDRDPSALLAAIAALRDHGQLAPGDLQVVFRATGQDDAYRIRVDEMRLADFVKVEPRLSRGEALAEMDRAHGLLIFQGSACNRQIPAKAYEYLARRRPIVGLCDPRGDTHDLLARQWGVPYMADMADPAAIARTIASFIAAVRQGVAHVPPAGIVEHHTRRAAARELAALFDSAVASTDAG
jgi:hypothetical protein